MGLQVPRVSTVIWLSAFLSPFQLRLVIRKSRLLYAVNNAVGCGEILLGIYYRRLYHEKHSIGFYNCLD